MEEDKIKTLEREISSILEEYKKSSTLEIKKISGLLEEEYKKENEDHISFLRNIALTAGVVAPFSLSLLSIESLDIQGTFLIIGFIILLFTIFISFYFSKKSIFNEKYKDTEKLAFNYIISKCLIDSLNTGLSLGEKVKNVSEIQNNFDDVEGKFGELGLKNKLAELRKILSKGSRYSFLFFSFGLAFIIISILYPHLDDFFIFYGLHELFFDLINFVKNI